MSTTTASSKHRQRFPDGGQAADLILPHVFEVAGAFETAMDVGGGTGAWCAALRRFGVARVVCINHPDVRADELAIDRSEFVACDMALAFPAPIRSDLVLCLEFAEHLPTSRSECLIEFLTSSGKVVLFSAAIPGQPSPYHVNEQPTDFWRELFSRRGFQRFDCVRPRIVSDGRVPYWYRQNMYLFAEATEAQNRNLVSLPFSEIPTDFELVHSSILRSYRATRHPKLKDVPSILKRSLGTRLKPRRA